MKLSLSSIWISSNGIASGGSDVDVNVGGLVFSCRVVVLKRNWFLSEDLAKLKAKADVSIFIGYAPAKKAYQIYNRRTKRIMETIQVDFDEPTSMPSEQSSLGLALHEMTPGTLSSGLVSQPPSSTPFVPQTRDDWDTLLQLFFNEYFCPPPCVDHPVPEVSSPVSVVSTGSPSLTSVDQDAPSPSTSQTP
ncbi:hypothetical protein Tco_1446805 [Tanacetum coccineum]